MKANYIWSKLIGFVGCLLPVLASKAQSTLCHSSFSCTEVSQSNVVIKPVVPGAWSQLYNTGGFTWEAWFRLKAPVKNGGIIVCVEDAVVFQGIFLVGMVLLTEKPAPSDLTSGIANTPKEAAPSPEK